MNKKLHQFKWFWPWQDEKEEAWLSSISNQGRHLVSVKPFGNYTFSIGEKENFVYRLDYQANKKDKESYLQLFQDAGWENIGEMSGWQYFRKRVETGEPPQIFTDVESKLAKYKRLLGYLIIFLPIYMVVFINSVFHGYPYAWWEIIRMLVFILILVWVYVIVGLSLRIRQLRRL
jgi:hypothetical protein